MKLTHAQKRYLAKAMFIGAGDRRGVRFALWSLGRTGTARALLNRGLIQGYIPDDPLTGYEVSDDGITEYLQIPFAERKAFQQEFNK